MNTKSSHHHHNTAYDHVENKLLETSLPVLVGSPKSTFFKMAHFLPPELIRQVINPCHARPPYRRTYPLGPGILWVCNPPNQKDFIDFNYCFNNVLYKQTEIET